MKLLHYPLILIFLLSVSIVTAQKDTLVPQDFEYDHTQNLQPVSFNKNDIEDFKSDTDFNYSEINENEGWWYRFKRWGYNIWDSFWKWLWGDYKANTLLAFFIKNLPYLILFLVICFTVYLFIKINPGGKTLKKQDAGKVFLSEEEKIIYTEDIQQLVQTALQNKQYRLAVRYSYLLVLKNLKDKEIIDYQFQKTNHDYLAEISSAQLNQHFQKVTKVYDFVWYGDFPISESEYKIAEKEFTAFQNQLN
ncbi:protein of unknown function [Mesonia phycicola]|uniref:Protein-glutamine gamma-glutamyltransferase-like C-terminal domain-containing protein n=1 Tax=Mesonia phycicola TaxID=579105 RepID=A0A1M6C585_9FLAO|nr:DUF4129 domain-containing protein [Mesonia phycicola]SHI56207.1 protein of unknown function [Mesonia phycicola]